MAARLRATAGYSGSQPGDPARAAAAMIRLAESDDPPRHFVLGAFGIDTVTARLCARLDEIERYREAGLATDFPKA